MTILVLDNIRSSHNVGAIFRTADAFGVSQIILTGITPYPETKHDSRLPHLRKAQTKQIAKTALGAEKTTEFSYHPDVETVLTQLVQMDFYLYALEQAPESILLPKLKPKFPAVLIVGNEVNGVSSVVLNKCNEIVEIPMVGQKESLNVSVATGIALYHFRQQHRNL